MVQHPIEKPRHAPPAYAPASLPFEGTSSYKSDFHPHPLPRQEAAGAQYQPRHIPFEGESSYKGDFVPHQLERRPPAGPNYVPSSLPFEGTSTYKDTFRPFPIQAPPRSMPMEYRGSGLPFEGTTESMDKYRAWAIDPANYQRGAPPPMRPSLPFDGTTTHREMFKGWQLPPRRPALGVQVVGNLAYVLIPANADIPACGRQVFTTVHDNQTEMDILILEGDFTQASMCNVLGQMTISGLAPAPKGTAKLEITMNVDANGVLNVTAHEQCNKRQEQWLKEGYLTAHLVHQ
ncbi:heat shock protein 70kD, peptide-binding domain-containing protein [Dunaliella salina]|uniref:Heat shock protein 70kD, peptide-binding domain-containing protein n=1 Tax=Dunaliella salina TaxID=3046 RepID=A0ABQ7H8V8_DUNSA|nr:heat shock protein 70kD, peptide-binding domain-containing protein [Dunaliella salina]|eukprot:KAF5843283.1 heat shock protein 70kD, peptide-binding domain-containing protein [Dunaliella salina]